MRKWLIYDCFWAAPFPLLIAMVVLALLGRKLSTERLLGDGQLFFFCAALAATALGDLADYRVNVPPGTSDARIAAIGPAQDALVLATAIFAMGYAIAMIVPSRRKVLLGYASLFFSFSTSMLIGWFRYYLNMW